MSARNYFDKPGNVKRLWRIFVGCLILLVLADVVIERHDGYFWENVPAFFAIYGFVACTLIVLIAKTFRRFLRRGEDYYE